MPRPVKFSRADACRRLLDRALEQLVAVMPDLPQLGIAMVVLAVAVAATHLHAHASAPDDGAIPFTPEDGR